MSKQTTEQRLAALEEFVGNCFDYRDGYVQFSFVQDADVISDIDPEFKDYLIELVKRC